MEYTTSSLRVSTMVVTAHWGTKINLEKIFQPLRDQIIPIWYPKEGILKIELNNKVLGSCYKDIFTNRKMTKKSFFNQATIILRRKVNYEELDTESKEEEKETQDAIWKEVNVKLFANGGIQMTGVFSEEFAYKSIEWLYRIISVLPEYPFEKEKENSNENENFISRFSTQLINTDYSIDKFINQDALHKILINEYNLFSMLEKTIYQGINTKFFYNTQNTDGICNCTKTCKGQGSGDGDQECKRITMSIFRTGKIIITGAREMCQITTAYDYLNNIIKKHCNTVLYEQFNYH
jgi:TATA-box binding protein (TBP) (component of TFIID and TFIIIB)